MKGQTFCRATSALKKDFGDEGSEPHSLPPSTKDKRRTRWSSAAARKARWAHPKQTPSAKKLRREKESVLETEGIDFPINATELAEEVVDLPPSEEASPDSINYKTPAMHDV